MYRMITSVEKDVGRIAGNAAAHAGLMARDLTTRWRSQLPKGQKVVDLQQVQICLRNDLHELRHEIRVIEQEHLEVLRKARVERGVRDIAIPQLRECLLGIRDLFESTFGASSSACIFGVETVSIPRAAFPLRRLAKQVHDRLTDPALVLPEAQLMGVAITPRALAKSFEEPLQKLDDALQKLEDELLPTASATLERKLRTLAELRRQAGIAARFLEALYTLAGHDEIAQRVRLSSHRARGKVSETAEEPLRGTSEDDPSGPDPSPAAPPPEGADEGPSREVVASVSSLPAPDLAA